MSEFKFSCPQCGQKMVGEDQYVGTSIHCPSCQGEIVVPQRMQPVSAGRIQVRAVGGAASHVAPPPPPPTPVAPMRHPYAKDPAADNSKAKMIITVVAICLVVLAPIILFVAFPEQVNALENKFGFAGKKADPDAGGGQLGHIADLYSVLDATDPEKGYAEYAKEKEQREAAERAEEEAQKAADLAEANAPLGEVSWNMSPGEESVPTGKPHGSISGTNFVADIMRVDRQANQYLLTLRQGTNAVPDCEIQIFLQLKPEEEIEGKIWTILPTQKSGAPRIIKKWKANPKFAPLQKVYAGSYAMRLEFGESVRRKIPVTIYVALPDAEKSFVGGHFKVDDFRKRFNSDGEEI